MTVEQFDEQMGRLVETYGERSYPNERKKIIWNAVRKLPDYWMESTVTQFIGNNRYAPMLKEFLAEVEEFEKQLAFNRATSRTVTPYDVLRDAKGNTQNKEFAQKCLEMLTQHNQGKLRGKMWHEACDYLDEAAKHYAEGKAAS